MAKLLIVNGSPRAPKSNTKQYAALFKQYWGAPADEYLVTANKHFQVCASLDQYRDVVLAFPLYADGLPVTLMHFLKELRLHGHQTKPTIHVLINCGFLEPEQNTVAVEMIRLFCRQNHFPFGSTLQIGSGEAILNTPFHFLVKRKIKKLAQAIQNGQPSHLKVTMPLSKKMFINASTKYWTNYGQKFQITPEQMATMHIEGQ